MVTGARPAFAYLLALPAAAALAAGPAGCVGPAPGDDDGEECADSQNRPPATPAVMAPEAGRIDIQPGLMAIQTSPFSDPDGDAHQASEFEIWRMAGGERAVRVWRAVVNDPARLTGVRLADGTFEVGSGALEEWVDYEVTARYRDDGTCAAWSEWSEPRRFRTDDGSEAYWFDTDSVRDVRIEIPPDSWSLIDAQAIPPGCVPYVRRYYQGSVVLDGRLFPGAGVRLKGGCGSARTLEQKGSFKVNLSWNDPALPGCPEERRSHGLKRLTLNSMVQDHSFVHERLAYELYHRMGVPTPRAAHVRVFVNDELMGLYTHVESIDRRFLARWFDDNDGMLYEGTYYCDLVPGNVPPLDEDSYCISRKFHPSDCESPAEGGDPEDYGPIREMVQALAALPEGGFYPAVTTLVDFDRFLSMWAVETIIGHWDSYTIQVVNNYRVYHDPSTDLWTFIPTGVDQTFEQRTQVGATAGLVAARCWADERCREAFLDRLGQAVDVFEQADLGAMAARIRDQIDPFVAEDPRKEGTHDEFVERVNQVIDFIDHRPSDIRAAL